MNEKKNRFFFLFCLSNVLICFASFFSFLDFLNK